MIELKAVRGYGAYTKQTICQLLLLLVGIAFAVRAANSTATARKCARPNVPGAAVECSLTAIHMRSFEVDICPSAHAKDGAA